ncbi:MAG: hypothetical protein RTV72_00345 [Candidatus Thorarchaeota archaeon]
MDKLLNRAGRRLAQLFSEYRYLIAVLLIGLIVWTVTFNIALVDYLNSSYWNSRCAWLGSYPGPADFNFFGYTIQYQLEGYSDYSFYYVHWGHQVVNGMLPYTDDFGYLMMDGIVNENGIYMFPPLTAYLYGAGIWLGNIIGPGNWGIGLLLASFGYLTAIPVYGIAKEISKNPRVGEIAALTYLLNPLVLYHTDYLWLNPSAFYFFFFAGFYALVKDRRHTGTVLIVTAALFKQTAWFLGIPLVVFLVLKKRQKPDLVLDSDGPLEDPDAEKTKESKFSFLTNYFDIRGFAVSVVVAVSYAGAIMLPFLIAQPHFWNYWRVALGHFSFGGNYTDLPAYGTPQNLPVLAIGAGNPGLAEMLDSILVTSAPMIFGVVVFTGAMLLLDKMDGDEHKFMRRLLFLTMLLMFWVSLTGARGVFKYYFALFGPFFAIFASGRMISGKDDHVPVSLSMFLTPFAFTLLILIPDRNIYLLYATIIFVLYLLAPLFTRLYDLAKRPFRFIKNRVSGRIPIELATTEVQQFSPESRLLRILEIFIVLSSIVMGAILFLYGAYICFPQVTAPIPVILQYFMVAGVLLFVGVQILSIAFNGLLSRDEQRSDLNYVLRTLSYTVAIVGLLFGVFSYTLSWNIGLFVERQALVVSSTLITIWALSLAIKLKKHLRLLAGTFLLSGAVVATWTWLSIGDAVMYTLGLAYAAGLIVYILFLLVDFLTPDVESGETSSEEIEAVAQ